MADDGRGLPEGENYEAIASMGFRIVESLVEDQLRGEMELTRDDGLEHRIVFERARKTTGDPSEPEEARSTA